MASKKAVHFLTLPPELRLMVYDHIIDSKPLKFYVEIRGDDTAKRSLLQFDMPLITAVCHMLRDETLPIVYKNADLKIRFHLDEANFGFALRSLKQIFEQIKGASAHTKQASGMSFTTAFKSVVLHPLRPFTSWNDLHLWKPLISFIWKLDLAPEIRNRKMPRGIYRFELRLSGCGHRIEEATRDLLAIGLARDSEGQKLDEVTVLERFNAEVDRLKNHGEGRKAIMSRAARAKRIAKRRAEWLAAQEARAAEEAMAAALQQADRQARLQVELAALDAEFILQSPSDYGMVIEMADNTLVYLPHPFRLKAAALGHLFTYMTTLPVHNPIANSGAPHPLLIDLFNPSPTGDVTYPLAVPDPPTQPLTAIQLAAPPTVPPPADPFQEDDIRPSAPGGQDLDPDDMMGDDPVRFREATQQVPSDISALPVWDIEDDEDNHDGRDFDDFYGASGEAEYGPAPKRARHE
ncbi:hypothetical protein Tdes44962_MAKER05085 [Teratosphaeria destructans]|uniref:Uncharacterized protein n=1 Tax=Teratosphaeria destructans TaxID=418781 RepID=A0A9W7SKY3_9PEZI|nr:hypothetical protein Tdes44962_MAKER05085 [Teratosphaeria destructans]